MSSMCMAAFVGSARPMATPGVVQKSPMRTCGRAASVCAPALGRRGGGGVPVARVRVRAWRVCVRARKLWGRRAAREADPWRGEGGVVGGEGEIARRHKLAATRRGQPGYLGDDGESRTAHLRGGKLGVCCGKGGIGCMLFNIPNILWTDVLRQP